MAELLQYTMMKNNTLKLYKNRHNYNAKIK